jgi:maltose O-acetyltransferase
MLADDLTNRLIRYPGAVAMRLRIVRLRLLGAHIGRNCWIRQIEVPRNPWDIVIGDDVALDDHVVLLTRRFKYLAAFPFLAAVTKYCTAGFDQ